MALLDLPPEILHLVCTHCDAGGVQSLRLTCRDVQSIADEHLLETVYGCFERGSLQRITEISRSSAKILKGVTSLVLEAGRLPEITFTQWRQKAEAKNEETLMYVNRHLNCWDPSSRWYRDSWWSTAWQQSTKESLLCFRACLERVRSEDADSVAACMYDHYKQYRRLCQDQKLMERQSLVSSCVADLFRACPRLTAIHLIDETYIQYDLGVDYEVALCNHTLQSGILLPQADAKLAAYVFREVMQAAGSTGKSLKKLAMGDVPLTVLREQGELTVNLDTMMIELEQLEWKLCGEDMDINMELFPEQVLHVAQQGCLVSMLSNCDKLRSMTISLPWTSREPEVLLDLKYVVGKGYWSMLEHLDLMEMKTAAGDLLGFLLLHKATLRSLILKDILLTDGTWVECFERLAGQLRHLQKLGIGHLKTLQTGGYIYLESAHDSQKACEVGALLQYFKNGGDIVPVEEKFLDGGG